MDAEESAQLDATVRQVADLEMQLAQIRDVLRQWTEAGQNLALTAAEAHAKNRAAGLGWGGILFGSKYRAIERRSATRSNARISQEAVKKRAQVTEGKRAAKEVETAIKNQLAEAKARLRMLQGSTKKTVSICAKPHSGVSLLKSLKEAHDLGLLTDDEYNAKSLTHNYPA